MEKEKNKIESSTLYLVATPIGNLADISERAKKVLGEVDFVAAEDTRNSMKLLSAYGITSELVSYHEHNKKSSGERIISRLLSGESCALITDAGMPAISDPGEDIVALAADAGIKVTVIPGACAAVSALSLSGLPTSKFVFEGFLPVKGAERKKRLDVLAGEERTMIVYEAPHKLKATLKDLSDTLGSSRRIALCRELTKLNEDIHRTSIGEAVKLYEERDPRGEYVLIIEGGEFVSLCSGAPRPDSPEELFNYYTEAEGLSKKDAIKQVAKELGVPKSEIYSLFTND